MPEEAQTKKENVDPILWEQEVYTDICRIDALLRSGIFYPENGGHVLKQSAFIELMICLHDLLQKAKKKDHEINFSDDVALAPKLENITDLVAVIRNAACHIHSQTRHVMGQRFILVSVTGKADGVKIGDFAVENPFEDDTAFFYGSQRIFLNRHIWRAFREARRALQPLTTSYAPDQYPPE